MTSKFLPHDLLRVSPAGVCTLPAIGQFSSLPLQDFPFVVVRRAPLEGGLIPVGIRGMQRHERRAAWLEPRYVLARIMPESIQPSAPLRDLPAMRAFLKLKRQWRDLNLTWGPGGSLGFELVSGCPVVREESDLDVVIRAPKSLPRDSLLMLGTLDSNLPWAIDIQVETLHGAFSPKEYANATNRFLLRTIHGPRLVEDPWLRHTGVEQVP